jgi:hypothetical protein
MKWDDLAKVASIICKTIIASLDKLWYAYVHKHSF